jgi:hypothetical protein
MANATLTLTATLTGGGTTKAIELQQCKRACELALQDARSAGGTKTSGTTVTEGNASATWSYTAVANS